NRYQTREIGQVAITGLVIVKLNTCSQVVIMRQIGNNRSIERSTIGNKRNRYTPPLVTINCCSPPLTAKSPCVSGVYQKRRRIKLSEVNVLCLYRLKAKCYCCNQCCTG